jgi:hypothetical protein
MGVDTMRIFVCDELINNLKINIVKIEEAYNQIGEKNHEAFFIYTFALFESAICEVMRHILIAFPEKISSEKYPKLKLRDIYDNISSPQYILYTLVDMEIKNITKGDAKSLLDKAENVCSVKLNYDEKILKDISGERNRLTHDNTISNQQYILGAMHSGKAIFKGEKCKEYVEILLNILREFSNEIQSKYKNYTKYKLINDLWNNVFHTPLLTFKDCVNIEDMEYGDHVSKVVRFDFEHIKSVSKSVSSSEKFYLALLLQQYSGRVNDNIFKFDDIPMLASISSKNIIIDILQVFSVYPTLFNGTNIDGSDLND